MSDNKDLLGNNPLTPSNNKFEFKGLDDLIVNPTQPNYEDLVSDDYSKMLQRHADDINRFAPKINHNLNARKIVTCLFVQATQVNEVRHIDFDVQL